MFDKKKLNFWRLAVIFTGITITILYLLWSSPNKSKSAMMDGSMGSMMKSMHISNLTVNGLLSNPKAPKQTADTEAHHQDSPIYKTAVVVTATVYLLLPLVIGGSIILAIIWIR
jgi:hypothetical protein